MAQQVRRRKQVDVAFSANNKVSEPLGRGYIYRELYLELTATLDDPTNAYAAVGLGDEWACVKKVDIVANGTDVIKSISGPMLRWLNFFWYGRFPTVSPALGAGSGDPELRSTLILPFWMPRSVRPIDTALDSRRLSDLKIEITWGDYDDVNGTTATGWITEPTLRVDSLESYGIDGPFANWRLWEIEKTITATTSEYQVQLPVGGMYRGFFMRTTDAGVMQGDILNNFKWRSGTNVFADVDSAIMRDVEMLRRGEQRSYSGTAYDDLAQANNESFEGIYAYDHVTDGMLTEAVDTAGFSEHELSLDVAVGGGTTKILILPSQVIPVRGRG